MHMSEPVVLRELMREDYAQVWAVRYAVTENTLTPGRIDDDDLRRETEETGKGWVIELDGRIEAFAIGNAVSGNVWALFVHPRAQGSGFGAMLHERLIEWFATQPVSRLWVSTGKNTRARGFYERRGWLCVGDYGELEVRLERANPSVAAR
jgi:GNAT superfamily N-acetyltransferase